MKFLRSLDSSILYIRSLVLFHISASISSSLQCLSLNVHTITGLYLSSRAVCKKFGLHVSRMMLAFLVLSTGMFCSSSGKHRQPRGSEFTNLLYRRTDERKHRLLQHECWVLTVRFITVRRPQIFLFFCAPHWQLA